MNTWSIAGCVDRVVGFLGSLERLTRPPKLGHDVDVPVDGDAGYHTCPVLAAQRSASPADPQPDFTPNMSDIGPVNDAFFKSSACTPGAESPEGMLTPTIPSGHPDLNDAPLTPSVFEIAEWTADAARFIGGLSEDVAAQVAASVACRVVDAIKQNPE